MEDFPIEFYNENLERSEPKHFYRIAEYVTTFEKDPGKNEPFSHDEDFKGNDLLKCRQEATKYYYERLMGLQEKGRYFLPFAPPEDFEMGRNAAYDISLYLVEYYNDSDYLLLPILGDSDEATAEGQEIESMLFNQQSTTEK